MTADPLAQNDNPEILTFAVPVDVWNQALAEALTEALRRSQVLRDWADGQVVKVIKEMAEDSPHIQSIRAEVADYMRRYPAISDDPRLQEKVATTIFEHMQRTVRR